jgi:hypothetical protein
VTCRVARLSSDIPRREVTLVFCRECGSSNLEVCYTSNAQWPHLCRTCAQSKVKYESWKKTLARLLIKEQPAA